MSSLWWFTPQISSACVSSLFPPCQMQLGTHPTARKELRASKVGVGGLVGFPPLAWHHPTTTQSGGQDRGCAPQHFLPVLPNTSFLIYPSPLSSIWQWQQCHSTFTDCLEILFYTFYDCFQLTFSH